ncbi:MAG: sulfurtransferase [Microbacterium sp.]|uniref:sulfurtransferase n=1 Tax=Microbacterium sp. TaxID=51671 RepID=UPI0039E348F0
MTHVIGPTGLAAALEAERPVRLLDVRWRLDLPEGRPSYVSGHLPGAVYVDLEQELANPGHPEQGRHPLPSHDALQAAVGRWGVDRGDLVVAYDDNDGVAAARLWWLLHRRGLDVKVLDGGVRGWVEAGGTLHSGDVRPRPGNAELSEAEPDAASIADTVRAALDGALIDARSPQHYRGTAPTPDPAAGHIPGAINVPTMAHIDAAGRLREPARIRRTFADAGAAGSVPLVVYCSSGIAAAHSALALAHAGVAARVFPGSWSQWSRAAGRPIATGPTPWGRVAAR